MSEDKKYIVKGSLINSLGIIASSISPALTFVLARFFPQEEFGLFISLQLFVLTASRFFILGLDRGLMWFIPQNQRDERAVHTGLYESLNITLLFSIFGFILGSILVLGGFLNYFNELSRLPTAVIIICIANIIPFMILNISAASFDGVRKPQYKIFINRFIVNTMFPVFAILCYYLGLDLYSLAIGFSFANMIGATWYYFLLKKHFTPWRFSVTIPKPLLMYSMPMVLSDVISSLLLRVDIWMVLSLLGPKKSAIYSIMVVLSNSVKTIRQNFDPLIVTVVAKMNRTTINNELKEVFSYSVNVVTAIQLAIALCLLFIPKEILLIAGKNYTTFPQALSILLMGNLVNGILGANGLILLGIGKSGVFMTINALSLAINIGGNLLFIPRYGIAGAAMASVISILIQNILCFVAVIMITKKHFYQKHLLINALLIGAISYAVFNYFTDIQSLELLDRILYLGISILSLGVVFLFKRKTFTLK